MLRQLACTYPYFFFLFLLLESDSPQQFFSSKILGTAESPPHSQGRHLSGYIGGSFRLRSSWKSALVAQHVALLTEFKVAFLIFHNSLCGFGAKVAYLLTSCLPAHTGDEVAKAADILSVEKRPV